MDSTKLAASSSHRVLGSSVLLTIASIGFMVPGLVRTKMAGLTLGEEGIAFFGQLSQMQTLLITIGGAGLATATRVILARNDLSDRDRSAAQAWLLWVPASLSIIMVTLVSVAGRPIAQFILGDDRYAIEIMLAAAGIPIAVMGQIVLATAQARREPRRLLVASTAAALGGGAVVSALMATKDHYIGASSLVFGPLVQLVMIVAICRSARGGFVTYPKLSVNRRREVVMLAWTSVVLGGFAAASELFSRSSVVHFRGLGELAAYQPVVLIVTTSMSLVLGAIATSSLLELAESSDMTWIGDKISEIAIKIIPLLGIIISMAILASPIAISALYVPTLVDESVPLVVFAFAGEPLRAFAWIAGSCLLPLGLRKRWLLVGLVTVAVQVAIASGLAFIWGAYALVAGLVAASVVTTIATLFALRRSNIFVSAHSVTVPIAVTGVVAGLPFLSITLFSTVIPGSLFAILALGLYLVLHSTLGSRFKKGRC